MIPAPCKPTSERRHTAREQQAEAHVTYRFHPRFGETVGVRRRLERGGAAFLIVHQLDGTSACLPAWMTDEAASRFEIGVEPRFPLDVLRSLRNEVDALLGFLASESKTEREHPYRSVFGCSCGLRPPVEGSALGDTHFRGHNAFIVITAR